MNYIKDKIVEGIKEKGVEKIKLSKQVNYQGYDKIGNKVDYVVIYDGVKEELGDLLRDIKLETGEEFFATVEVARSELIKVGDQ